MKRKRLCYAAGFVILFITEIIIALYVHDSFVRPYVGDVLVTVLLFCFVRILIPEKHRLLPLYIFIFAAGVEILQYFRFVELLGLGDNAFFRVLLGSVFDFKDIICYGVGCLLGAIADALF